MARLCLSALPRLSSLISHDIIAKLYCHASVTPVCGIHTAVGLSPEQEELREQALAFARSELVPHSSQWDAAKHFPVTTIKHLGQLGYGGCFVEEAYGGSNLARADAAVLFEALAYGDVPVAAYVTIHNMVGRVISKFASESAKSKHLRGVAALDTLTSYCLTEPGSGSDAASLMTCAARTGDGYKLTGSKAFISGGMTQAIEEHDDFEPQRTQYIIYATPVIGVPMKTGTLVRLNKPGGVSDLYLVMARSQPSSTGASGISAFLVDGKSPGLTFGKQEEKMGWRCQPTCTVNFDQVHVPADHLLGSEGEGFKIAMSALDGGRINIAACSIGGAQFCFDKCKGYIRDRKQFGRQVDEFQNSQFHMADNATKLVASRLLTQQAARALDAQEPMGTMLAAMAKRFATDSCYEVVDSCLQLHGGYGYIQDYLIEQRLRDLRVHSILEGTNEIMRKVIWNGLQREAAM